ncbi:MAG: TIM barrel protein [archaeon]
MAKIGDYTIADLYQGGHSSFKSNYIGGISAGSLGLTTDPRVGNILQEVSTKLSTGVKDIEIELVSPDMLDQIPKQQFEEVKRQAKLVGAETSVHGPVIDTTGINQQGFSELNREASERKIIETIRRSHELNPKGNVPVNFHSAEGIQGTEWEKIPDQAKGIEGQAKRLIVVNRESGKMAPLEKDERYRAGEDLSKPRIMVPEKRLQELNVTEWDNSISQILFNKERADEILQKNAPMINTIINNKGQLRFDEETIKKSPTTWQAIKHVENASAYIEDTYQQLTTLFNKAYKYGDNNQREELKNLSERFTKVMKENGGDIMKMSDSMQVLISGLKKQEIAPQMYVPVEQFATQQSAKTFGNAAFEGWKEFKDNTPLVNIENPPVGFALSTGEDLKNLVKASRKHFVEKAVESGKLSTKEAEKQAEKIIGATWDVGHINMLRKQGFDDKDIIKETEKIAPYVKHVHLSDNFGLEHTELPMGMGNVPIKEIMDKLGKKGFEAKKIIEAAHWWQHFKTPPVQATLEAMGSPIYTDGVGPYWSQTTGLYQGYFGGYGMMLPQTHYQTFGSGFSQLPQELGGQAQGAQGNRMSGRGME